jgi:gluconolactonase
MLPPIRPVTQVAVGLAFPEAPAFDRDGSMFVAEMAGGTIAAIDLGSGRVYERVTTGGGPNGIALGPGGALYVTNHGGIPWDGHTLDMSSTETASTPRVERVGPGGTVMELYKSSAGLPLLGPADIALDDHAGIWFTDPGAGGLDEHRGRVWYAHPDGSCATIAADGYQFPNGLAFRDGGAELLVAETGSGRIWLHAVLGPGLLGPRRPFARLSHGRPDGLCVDLAGNVLAAATFSGAVRVFDAAGREIEAIAMPDKLVTNVTLHPQQPTAYVTLARTGMLVSFRWDRAGMPLPFLSLD